MNKKEYIEAINELLIQCNDEIMLEFIYSLLNKVSK